MRDKAPMLLILVLIVAGIAGLFALANSAENRRLDNSVIGINGLPHFFDQNDVAYKRAHPRLSPHVDDLGLRILPLYDLNLAASSLPPQNEHDLFFQTDMRDIFAEDLFTKLRELPTLLVLPKWVRGTIDNKTAYKGTLIPITRYRLLLGQLELGNLRLLRGANDMASKGGVSLFLPQVFDPNSLSPDCKPIRMFGAGVLIARCALDKNQTSYFYLLSDPDLINNHGLAVGQNGTTLLDLLQQLSPPGGHPVYIDTSPDLLVTVGNDRDERREYSRSASDFARFFAPPLDALWAMLLIVTGILMWRGSVRFGPVQTDRENNPEQSKSEAIATNARLLRLTGHDGNLVADFVRGQLAELARQTFGAAAGQTAVSRYFAFLARRDADLARAFQTSATKLINQGPTMPRARLSAELANYRTLLESVTDAHDPK